MFSSQKEFQVLQIQMLLFVYNKLFPKAMLWTGKIVSVIN